MVLCDAPRLESRQKACGSNPVLILHELDVWLYNSSNPRRKATAVDKSTDA